MSKTPESLLTIYVVREINSRRIVGIFVLPESEGDLAMAIDEVIEPEWCEYAILPSFSLIWDEDKGPRFPDLLKEHAEHPFNENVWFGGDAQVALDEIDTWKKIAKGWVYFIKAGDFIKIGFALDVATRVKALQTGSAETLQLLWQCPGDQKEEANWHAKFHEQHKRGEWFRYEGQLKEFLESDP